MLQTKPTTIIKRFWAMLLQGTGMNFKNSISNYYFQIPLTSNRVIILDNLSFEVEGKKTVGDFIKNEREKLKNEEEKRYQTFKDYLLTKYEELSSEGKELNTGFLIKDKELQEKGFKKSIEINIFLDRMKKERIIDILQPDPKISLRGKIIIKGG
jgi:NOL1/NOP2/fmu family ribosome biogenesis protein